MFTTFANRQRHRMPKSLKSIEFKSITNTLCQVKSLLVAVVNHLMSFFLSIYYLENDTMNRDPYSDPNESNYEAYNIPIYPKFFRKKKRRSQKYLICTNARVFAGQRRSSSSKITNLETAASNRSSVSSP